MNHYPVQTADGRTYVMRARRAGLAPVIVEEVTSTPDTTRRWLIAKSKAKALDRAAASAKVDWPIVAMWGLILAFFVAAVIVATVLVGN